MPTVRMKANIPGEWIKNRKKDKVRRAIEGDCRFS